MILNFGQCQVLGPRKFVCKFQPKVFIRLSPTGMYDIGFLFVSFFPFPFLTGEDSVCEACNGECYGEFGGESRKMVAASFVLGVKNYRDSFG